MADEIISRDQNFRTVGAGVSPDSDFDISMLRVDPVTKYLLVAIENDTPGSATAGQIAKRDGNHRPVAMAWNETAGELQEILTDADGNLCCDITYI